MEPTVHSLATATFLLLLAAIFASITLPNGVYLGHWAPALLMIYTVCYTFFALREKRRTRP